MVFQNPVFNLNLFILICNVEVQTSLKSSVNSKLYDLKKH